MTTPPGPVVRSGFTWSRESQLADAVVALQVREAQARRQALIAAGWKAAVRIGDPEDPGPEFLEIKERHGSRVALPLGRRGMDPELLNHTRQAWLADATQEIVGPLEVITMRSF